MEKRKKDLQEQGTDKGKRVLSFGIRHPLIFLVLIVIGVIVIFVWSLIGSAGAMATAGLGVIGGVGGGGAGGYLGGSGEEYKNATETQKKIADSCQLTPTTGAGMCATWVYNVYANIGYLGVGGNANDMWANFCYTNDTSELEVGMVIAVLHSGPTGDSWNYGHVGIYVGDDMVMHSTGKVEVTPLEDWIKIFDPYNTVKWGFPPAVKTIIEQEQKEKADTKTAQKNEKGGDGIEGR